MSDQERMASEYEKLVAMMREQRDGFRIPRDKGGLGASHSDEARHCMAELLDWFLVSYYDPRPMAKISFVMPSGDFKLDVSWANSPRKFDVVDLRDIVMSRKMLRPLRDDRELWNSVRVIGYGNAIAWGHSRSTDPRDEDDYEMDFSAGGLHSLAEEQHPYRGKVRVEPKDAPSGEASKD